MKVKIVLALLLAGCATVQTKEGAKELTRDAIHAHHDTCLMFVKAEESRHGGNALAAFRCDQESDNECIGAGLEHKCDQWQFGGT